MAAPILHIKDSYFFEVPKPLWRYDYTDKSQFPDVWVRNDPHYQLWEAERMYEALEQQGMLGEGAPGFEQLAEQYEAWKHEGHDNFGRPFDVFLEQAASQQWFQEKLEDPAFRQQWQAVAAVDRVEDYQGSSIEWAPEKIAGYNQALSGKVIIPQPFATLRNLHEKESGFAISRFMIIELLVAIVLALVCIWLSRRMKTYNAPKGRRWNMLEAILIFLRDEVARPAIGRHDADRFVPLLWTVFLFVLACNLMGLLPWAGAPTGAFAVTLALALVTLGTVFISGMAKFGVLGFWKNQVPSMDLPLPLAVIIKPMIFVIEVLGMFIRHGVLAIRLLANMVAGHLVLLGIMGLAFGAEAALAHADSSTMMWGLSAVIALIGSTLFTCLELFVAFLQAYIFTFLSALFIGAAVHHH